MRFHENSFGQMTVGCEKWRGGERVRPQQDAKREKSERRRLDQTRNFQSRSAAKKTATAPSIHNDCEQNIPPDDADQDERGW